MATDCSQEAILSFLTERGGRVKNTDLTDRFKAAFPHEPEQRAAARDRFKRYVDNVAFVSVDGGVKFVCLRKRYRGLVNGNGTTRPGTEPVPGRVCDDGGTELRAQPEVSPGSGYGSPKVFPPATILPDDDAAAEKRHGPAVVCVDEDTANSSSEMGNLVGSKDGGKSESEEEEEVGCVQTPQEIPVIAVIEASPLPASAVEGSKFIMPGPRPPGTPGQVDSPTGPAPTGLSLLGTPGQVDSPPGLRLPGTSAQVDSPPGLSPADPVYTESASARRRNSTPLPGFLADDGQSDCQSLSGSEGTSSPRTSRKHFLEAMMNSSPQVRRSMVLRNSVYLATSDTSDSISLASSTATEEDGTSVTLDPLEHEWMICASDGHWDSLYQLLAAEPGLALKKDFVTGFTCLHWAAKQGKPELLALIINFAKQHAVPVDVNARSSAGYTPLHLAAMHSHMEVVKLLVGAYDADVEIRDYSGKKAGQYLTSSVAADIRDIIGAYEECSRQETASGGRGEGRWRFSKVLQSNLKLLGHGEGDAADGEERPRRKPLRRKSSLGGGVKPRLEKIRYRTSQLVRSTSFLETEAMEGSLKAFFKSRPKSNVIG
ncbi:ankyrin repeat domain-containing protein SOWAHC-like [Diretmus argenteus]